MFCWGLKESSQRSFRNKHIWLSSLKQVWSSLGDLCRWFPPVSGHGGLPAGTGSIPGSYLAGPEPHWRPSKSEACARWEFPCVHNVSLKAKRRLTAGPLTDVCCCWVLTYIWRSSAHCLFPSAVLTTWWIVGWAQPGTPTWAPRTSHNQSLPSAQNHMDPRWMGGKENRIQHTKVNITFKPLKTPFC